MQLIKSVIGVYNRDDYRAILSYLQSCCPLMAVLWSVGVETGFRISDLLRLKISDIDVKGKICLIERKTKKQRTAAITFNTMQNLGYFQGKKSKSDTGLLFPFTRQQVWRVISKAGKACGIPNLGAHSMRKTYAWMELMRSASVQTVQDNLLHTYQSTTLQYLKPGLENAVKTGQITF